MRDNWLRLGALLVVAFPLLAATAPVPGTIVSLDYSSSTDFAKYRSYSWLPRNVSEGVTPSDYDRVLASVDRALSPRFTKGNPGEFAISVTATPSQQSAFEGSSYGGYTGGTLTIQIFDAATKQPIWRGMARLDWNNPDGAVGRLMNRFPPSHGCADIPKDSFETCPK